ncbi:dynamin-1-like protein [Thrips palmi]|uniref:Dynamin-1-like protein n=1 Tax=Thrips palmi TaxID=161013 RepID=A0A6P8YRL3_THRPL|nr:dynamin-1-like protein [Thrips palmi]
MIVTGDDAYDILTGKSVSLKLGIIGVVNRSQKDINNEKPIEECLKKESAFFKQKYPDLASRMGTSYLLKELSSLLLDHVKKCLPSVKVKVQRQIQDCENKLEVTGSQVDDSDEFLRDVIAQFSDAFCRKLESQTPNIERAALFGGAHVSHIFNQLKKSLQEVSPCDKYCVEEVVMAIRNADGTRPPILVSLYAFEALMKPLIEKMLPLSIGCVRLVMDELQAVSEDSLPKKVEKFPILKQETDTIVRKVIQECAVKAKEMIKDLNEIELGHITYDEFECIEELFAKTAADATLTLPFKSDPDFLNRLTENEAVKIFPDLVTEIEPKHQKQIMVLGKMLKHYYDVVAKTVSDGVCKTIMTYLVNRVKRNLAVRLMTHLFQADLQDDLFQEDEKTVQLRAETTTKLEVLKNVERVLSNVL